MSWTTNQRLVFRTTLFIPCFVMMIVTYSQAGSFLAPDQISVDAVTAYNTPTSLINEATTNGGINYNAQSAGSGGSGNHLAWYTGTPGSTPVTLTFGFGEAKVLEELYMWDYYWHSPTDWNLSLFSGANLTGTQLLDFNFSNAQNNAATSSAKHVHDFSDASGVLSGTLTTRNSSTNGGVGLSEVGFIGGDAPVIPEPSSLAIFGIGAGLIVLQRRKHKLES